MNREVPLPTHGPIKARCRIVASVESALCRHAGVRMIACSASRSGFRGFLIVEPKILNEMDERPREALIQSRIVVDRILGGLKLELFNEATRRGEQETFARYWPKYVAPRKAEGSARSTARQFFDTFGDGSSVWTHESNWKKRDA